MKTGIVVLSDRCAAGAAEDRSGPLLEELAGGAGWEVVERKLLSDDPEPLVGLLCRWADRDNLDIILTSGGTGISPRDHAPEATRKVIAREIPGIPEALRIRNLEAHPTSCLSRMVAGLRGKTLIVNLPGSPGALRECWPFLRAVVPHAIRVASGRPVDCGREPGGDA